MKKIKKISKHSEKRALRKFRWNLKIKLFKHWLIKKLGGYTGDELKEPYVVVHCSGDKLVTINQVYYIPIEDIALYECLDNVKSYLADKLFEALIPEFEILEDVKPGLVRIKAHMTIPSKYVRGVTNEENGLQ